MIKAYSVSCGPIISLGDKEIINPSSFTWEIGVSEPEVGTNPSLNQRYAEVQTGSDRIDPTEGLDTTSPR